MKVSISQHPRLAIKEILRHIDERISELEGLSLEHDLGQITDQAYLTRTARAESDLLRKIEAIAAGRSDDWLAGKIKKATDSNPQPQFGYSKTK